MHAAYSGVACLRNVLIRGGRQGSEMQAGDCHESEWKAAEIVRAMMLCSGRGDVNALQGRCIAALISGACIAPAYAA